MGDASGVASAVVNLHRLPALGNATANMVAVPCETGVIAQSG